MLLYYHSYYNVLYAGILIPTGVLKLMVGSKQLPPILSFALTCLYCLTEFFRVNFGYKGNINESFPELIAFFLQSTLFSLVFTIVPYTAAEQYPHEQSMYVINLMFLFFEIVVGFFVMIRFSNTQSAAFYRRTAPLIDKKFRKKYQAMENQGAGSKRDIQIGMKQIQQTAESENVFEDSDK